MWYPEEAVSYCPRCDLEIPVEYYWRGRGRIVGRRGRLFRTAIVFSLCPGCGRRYSTGLNGPLPYRLWYAWIWKLRYPATTPPDIGIEPVESFEEEPEEARRRAAG